MRSPSAGKCAYTMTAQATERADIIDWCDLKLGAELTSLKGSENYKGKLNTTGGMCET